MLCHVFFKEATKQLDVFAVVKNIFNTLTWVLIRSLLGWFRWRIFYNRKYLHLCVGFLSEMQYDFSLGTVNISGWHCGRKMQKLIFLVFWFMLSEIHFNGYWKCGCKMQNFVKGNHILLNLDHNLVILSWEDTSEEWVFLLLSHQSISNA